MVDVAAFVRIFDAEPSDETVTKRIAAVKDISARLDKITLVPEIFAAADAVARSVEAPLGVGSKVGELVEAALRKAAKAFIPDGQELQMTVCGLMGALQKIEDGSPSKGDLLINDVFAIGLWSALSFQVPVQEPRLEQLRSSLLKRAHFFIQQTASTSRQRKNVPDFKPKATAEGDLSALAEAMRESAQQSISALRANAAVDREELDLLWWVLGDWSHTLEASYSTGSRNALLAVVAGLEAGNMLRRMPADAHKHLVLRHARNDATYTLSELLAEIGDDVGRIGEQFKGNSTLERCPNVFPLLAALNGNVGTSPKFEVSRTVAEWGARALLESSALHVTSQLPSVAK